MIENEPSYLAFARAAVSRGERISPTIARELISRIDRDAAAIKSAEVMKP